MPQPGENRPIQILVVDDSAVVRQVMHAVLSQEDDMEISVAADPLIAMTKMKQKRPDVLLLDVEMPRMDGLTFLRNIMAEDPIPTLICSGLAAQGTDVALRALDLGAVGIVTKPKVGVNGFLHESALTLIDMVRAASQARVRPRGLLPLLAKSPSPSPPPRRELRSPAAAVEKMIAIGASTGGTEALETVLTALSADAPAIVIVQHMPEFFTAAFAKRLNATCRIPVKEAADGDRLLPGAAFVAPGNRHLSVHRTGSDYILQVHDGPLVSRHRPSVDVLFRSVARAAGPDSVGIIMTGMGSDGALGLLEMKRAGAYTIAQDEATSVVFGMPKQAIAERAVDHVAPLHDMARLIMQSVHPVKPLRVVPAARP
ncbi:MAG: chemotaxis response regulator protein-glutamate methylesterase [Acidobacteriia bacterium]|nr:chemotaxis response regulator protein-glutamate methylesterase [Terriglobia bacterium]